MARRSGIPTMIWTGKKMQNLITNYSGTIQEMHPTKTGLLAALVDCAQCLVVLLQELAAVREHGD